MLRPATSLVLLAFLTLSSSGCAVLMLGQGHEDGSGLLSDAAARAGADSTTKIKAAPPDVGYTVPPTTGPLAPVEPEPESEPAERIAGDSEKGAAVAPTPHAPTPRTRRLFAGLVAGGGALGGEDYDGFATLGVSVGGYPQPRVRVDGTATLNGLAFRDGTILGRAFDDPGELNLDVTVRYYLTHDRTFLGIYPLAGVGTGTMLWNYATPVTVIEDGVPRQLGDDQINYFSIFAGAGMSLMQTRYVHFGGSLSGGVRFYGWHTQSGLKNDMLPTTGYVKVLVEMSFRVAKV